MVLQEQIETQYIDKNDGDNKQLLREIAQAEKEILKHLPHSYLAVAFIGESYFKSVSDEMLKG